MEDARAPDSTVTSSTAAVSAAAGGPTVRRPTGFLERFSAAASNWTARNSAFACALTLVVGWAVSGPIFNYSDRWVLFINGVTSIVTFLMVFLIQRAQNKDTLALQLKVNELLAAHEHARNSLIAIEGLSEQELRGLHDGFTHLGAMARDDLDSAAATQRCNTEAPEIGPK